VREICTLGLRWRELETELWDGLRHRLLAKAAGNGYSPSPKATAPVLDPTRIQRSKSWLVGTTRQKDIVCLLHGFLLDILSMFTWIIVPY
jgi:hypothetical protein